MTSQFAAAKRPKQDEISQHELFSTTGFGTNRKGYSVPLTSHFRLSAVAGVERPTLNISSIMTPDATVRQRIRWSQKETDALFSGLVKHKKKSWGKILIDDEFVHALKLRTATDLKDRFRAIENSNFDFTEFYLVRDEAEEEEKERKMNGPSTPAGWDGTELSLPFVQGKRWMSTTPALQRRTIAGSGGIRVRKRVCCSIEEEQALVSDLFFLILSCYILLWPLFSTLLTY